MRRRLFRILLGFTVLASFLLFVANLILWICGYIAPRVGAHRKIAIGAENARICDTDWYASRGRMVLRIGCSTYGVNETTRALLELKRRERVFATYSLAAPPFIPTGSAVTREYGFAWTVRKANNEKWIPKFTWTGYCVAAPNWFVQLLTAIPLVAWVMSRRKRRQLQNRLRAGLCPACGYDLRASPERCPECGRVSTAELTIKTPATGYSPREHQ